MGNRTDTPGGFTRCPSCHTMWGPVPLCPRCGYGRACSWCKVRAWIPGAGWSVSPAAQDCQSHGVCPWCTVTVWGGNPGVVNTAAGRLGEPGGLLHVRTTRLATGHLFLRVLSADQTRTGWAGLIHQTISTKGA
jgi:hypothetical protein